MYNEQIHIVNALAPDADALAGTKTSDVINMKNFGHCEFVVQKGEGTTGTSTITVLACDDATPSTTSAIAFKYRACTSGDTFTALTAATTAGFTTTAGSNQMYRIEVDANDLPDGYPYLQLKLVEAADGAVDAGVLAILTEPRYAQSINATAIV